MTNSTTVVGLGYYCGRFGPGFWGEPFNQLGNLAFIAGALIAFRIWRRQLQRDPWQLPLFMLAGLIGVGSLIFHGHPTPLTLTADLVPIQLFGLAVMGYILRRNLSGSPVATVAVLLGFFLVRQVSIRGVPPVLGGGVTHIPAVLMLLELGVALRRRRSALARYLFMASAAYVAALAVRTADLPLCASFPVGLHWAWHVLTAMAPFFLLLGITRHSSARGLSVKPPVVGPVKHQIGVPE